MNFLNRLSRSQRHQLQQTLQQFPEEVWELDINTLNAFVLERPSRQHARPVAAKPMKPAILT